MKIQPIDTTSVSKGSIRADPSAKPVMKSRLKRLIERQFPSVLRISSAEKLGGGCGEPQQQHCIKDGGGGGDFEPSSVCLDKMVQNFIEENSEKQTVAKCGRRRCNCFNGNCSDSDDDELEFSSGGDNQLASAAGDACEVLKSLVPCASTSERNLLADAAKIVEKNKICRRKDDCRMMVMDGLASLGYDASICKSRWEKSPSFPADVVVEGERLLVDIDFRSEFEIARSTGSYRAILQSLPSIFIGKPDRLQQIVAVVSEAAKQSLKKKGLHFPPWRKPEYMRAKWLAPYQRLKPAVQDDAGAGVVSESPSPCLIKTRNFSGEFELIYGEKSSVSPGNNESGGAQEKITVVVSPWQPPAVKPRVSGAKIVTGLASVLIEKP
ncbi:hypothetical protein ACLOJK_026870 [Asimina triloba]